jgi:hypothetical protein
VPPPELGQDESPNRTDAKYNDQSIEMNAPSADTRNENKSSLFVNLNTIIHVILLKNSTEEAASALLMGLKLC